MGLSIKDRLLALPTIISLEWKCLAALTNALAYQRKLYKPRRLFYQQFIVPNIIAYNH
jgi:hypothetical protein